MKTQSTATRNANYLHFRQMALDAARDHRQASREARTASTPEVAAFHQRQSAYKLGRYLAFKSAARYVKHDA